MPFLRGLRLVMTHGPYVKLIAGFLFTSLAFMVSWGPNLGEVSRWDKAWDTGGVSGLSKVPWNAGMSPGGGIPISPVFLCSPPPSCPIPSLWKETSPCFAPTLWTSAMNSRICSWPSWCVWGLGLRGSKTGRQVRVRVRAWLEWSPRWARIYEGRREMAPDCWLDLTYHCLGRTKKEKLLVPTSTQ